MPQWTDLEEEEYLETIRRTVREGPYRADWNSLWEAPPPPWFSQAKFGIFIHWGLYSLAAHRNEWYSRNMYIKEKEEWEHHRKTYGPHTEFGYKDFIPLFQAKAFDPGEWTELFAEAGVRYVVPVAEHHDGFQMYRSRISSWNAWDMGPHRDILGELKEAALRRGLRFGTSSHRAEHWFFMGHGREFESDVREPMKKGDFYWPAMVEPDPEDLKSRPCPSEEFLRDWLVRTCEIVDRYQPSILYFDWWIQHEAFKPWLKLAAAYYYNRGCQWGTPVSICYKHDAMAFGTGISEMERGGFDQAVPFPWQTDTAIANNSWCYTDSLEYKTSRQIICSLIETVSKNGNLLLNVGPKGDGSIPEKDREILRDIGRWLKVNGEGIYHSRPWRMWGEGTVKPARGQFSDQTEPPYTGEDIRFTAAGDSVYAFVMAWPEDGRVRIRALGEAENPDLGEFHGLIRRVEIPGQERAPVWSRNREGLFVEAPWVKSPMPVAVRVVME